MLLNNTSYSCVLVGTPFRRQDIEVFLEVFEAFDFSACKSVGNMLLNNTYDSFVLVGTPFHRQDIEVFLGTVFLDLPSPVWSPICVPLMNWSLSTSPSTRATDFRKNLAGTAGGDHAFRP